MNYEYKVTRVETSLEVEAAINEVVKTGWEFVSLTRGHNVYVMVFRRGENKPVIASTIKVKGKK